METKKRVIYPSCARINSMVGNYSDIAVENYAKAKSLYKQIEEVGFKELELEHQYRNFCHSVIISVVFSAMAIEAFINDYGAACLGDDFFYENFDRLSVIGKLQLISKFLFESDLDKSKEYYFCLKTVFSARDKFVHNKSETAYTYLKRNGYTVHRTLEESLEALNHMADEPILDEEDLKKDLKLSNIAITAMKKIADLFDNNDANAFAMIRFFHVGISSNTDCVPFQDTYKEFEIK